MEQQNKWIHLPDEDRTPLTPELRNTIRTVINELCADIFHRDRIPDISFIISTSDPKIAIEALQKYIPAVTLEKVIADAKIRLNNEPDSSVK
jgi:hypothetical protein